MPFLSLSLLPYRFQLSTPSQITWTRLPVLCSAARLPDLSQLDVAMSAFLYWGPQSPLAVIFCSYSSLKFFLPFPFWTSCGSGFLFLQVLESLPFLESCSQLRKQSLHLTLLNSLIFVWYWFPVTILTNKVGTSREWFDHIFIIKVKLIAV